MSVFVFLGPSLPLEEARGILNAEFLGPVKMGDVQALIPRNPSTICIIDGYFERVPSVWHKEILYALSCGIRVIGASSMGALRAAELHTFGMEGVGAIFEAYRDGLVEDDDEVAVAHATGSDGYRTLSEPLINIRFVLCDAERSGVVTSTTAERLLQLARARFYPDRSWAQLFADAHASGVDEVEVGRLRDLINKTRPNAKRDDAKLALRAAASSVDSKPKVTFDFEPTVFWRRLVATTARSAAQKQSVLISDVLQHAMLTLDDMEDLTLRALVFELVLAESERLGYDASPEEITQAAERFRRTHGMLAAVDMLTWLDQQELTKRDFTELMRLQVLTDKISEHYGPAIRSKGGLELELKRRGRFADLRNVAAQKQYARTQATQDDASVSDDVLIAWYEKRFRPIHDSREVHARQRGFPSLGEFLREILATYLFENSAPSTTDASEKP